MNLRTSSMNLRKSFLPSRAIISLGVIAAAALSTPFASAASITWTGSTSTSITDPTNWAGGVAPSSGDIAVFPASLTANQPNTQTAGGATYGQYDLLTTTGGWTIGASSYQTTLNGVTTAITSTTSALVGINASAMTSGSDVINNSIRIGNTQDWWVGPRTGASTGILVINYGLVSVGNVSIAQIGDGSVQFNAAAITGTVANQYWSGAQYSVNDSGSLIINANDIFGVGTTLLNWNSAGGITVIGNRTLDSNMSNGGGTLPITGTLTVTGTFLANTGVRPLSLNGQLSLTGVIKDASSLGVMAYQGLSGTSTAIFNISGNNIYTGSTVITGNTSGGSVTVNAMSNTAFGTGTVTISNGAIIGASNLAISLANTLVITNSMATAGSNALTFTGSTVLNSATGTTAIYAGNSGLTTFSGPIVNGSSGASTLVTGGGDIQLSGANTYTGATIVNTTGRFRLATMGNAGAASSLGASSNAASNLVFNGNGVNVIYYGSGTGSTDRLFTIGSTVSSITFDSRSAGMAFTNTGALVIGAGAKTITLRSSSAPGLTSVMNPSISDASDGAAVSVIKIDTNSTWVLGGANTYSGSTVVSAGSLLVAGSLSGSSAVSIAAGGTMGVGKAAGATSFGTLNASSMLLSGTNSALKLTMGNTGASDSYATSGAITITGANFNMILTLDTGVSDLSGNYTLLTWGTGSVITPGQINLAGSSAQILSDISGGTYALQDSGNSLMLVAVPEPATWALFGCGLAVAGATWKKKRKPGTSR